MIFLLCNKASREALLKKHCGLIREQAYPNGRGFTSVYIEDRDIERAWNLPEVNRALPWRYRAKPTQIRLYPTPAGVSVNVLQESLSVSVFQGIQEKVTRQFGGRCQICGSAQLNARERRISPRLYATWLHTPHPNPRRKVGMRELLGVASACDRCMDVLTVADARPCPGYPKKDRHMAWQKALQNLAIHNHWNGKQTRREVTRTIHNRKALDDIEWVHDLNWLVRQKLIASSDLALSHSFLKQGYLLSDRRYLMPPVLSDSRPAAQSPDRSPQAQMKAS
jgi:hypothetical protein